MAALGAFLAPFVGYFRRPRNGVASATMVGTAMFDASIARDMVSQIEENVVQMRRLADAAETLIEIEQSRDKRLAAERHDSEIETLRREIEELKRGKR